MSDNCKILRGVTLPNPAIILPETDVQAPMQTVFHTPVSSYASGELFGIRR